MYCLVKDKFLYITIPKNGYRTFLGLLGDRHGWERVDLFDNNLKLEDYLIWAHITEPNQRHTRGVEQYLRLNPEIDIKNPEIARLMVSGVFDEHGYSIHMLIGHLMHLPIHWIPLDYKITDWHNGGAVLNGNDLTNKFFEEHGLDIKVTDSDIINKSKPHRKLVQEEVNVLKDLYRPNYEQLVKNLLDPDIILYNKVLKQYRLKYGSEL